MQMSSLQYNFDRLKGNVNFSIHLNYKLMEELKFAASLFFWVCSFNLFQIKKKSMQEN